MFMEKVVMQASPRNFILVDQSKMVTKLGEKVSRFRWKCCPWRLRVVERRVGHGRASKSTLRWQ